MLITAVTMEVSSGAVVIWRTNDWSILRASMGNFLRIAQAGVTRAEVIHGQLHTSGAQSFQDRLRGFCAFHENTFGELELQSGGIQTRFVEDCEHALQEIVIAKLHCGNVYRHGGQGQARAHPGLRLGARFAQDPIADGDDQAAVFGNGNEIPWRDQPAQGMGPADQCFRAGDFSGLEIDLGLIVQCEFLAFESAPQTLLDGLALHGTNVHGGLEKLVTLAAIFLGLIHGGVRVLDEGLGVQAVVGIDADANAGGDVQIVLVDGMSVRDGLQHSSRGDRSILGLLHFRKQHDEFIASLAADGVRGAHAIHQAFGNGLQKFVAGRMPQGIVDVFEAVQIQKQHRDFLRRGAVPARWPG